jgi:hypothetical protein
MTFGFIITRHVNSELTNNYWNECVRSIRICYPLVKIIIIDDNSIKEYVKSFLEYNNIEIVESEYPKRGELLPYYYFHKNKYFDNAIILHDSVFIKKRVNFEKFEVNKINVLPLWHFTEMDLPENITNSFRLLSYLKNKDALKYMFLRILNKYENLGFQKKWYGCFGVQSYINYSFLCYLQEKYNIFNLLNAITCRKDRCSLERVFGALFYLEYPKIIKTPSLLGHIRTYMRYGYTYQQYIEDIKRKDKKLLILPIIKVWTGR